MTHLTNTDLFDTDGAIYMGSQRTPEHCDVGLFGVPYDGTTSFRPGTRFGPAAIREVGHQLSSRAMKAGMAAKPPRCQRGLQMWHPSAIAAARFLLGWR